MRHAAAFMILIIAAVVSGCASAAKPEAMIASLTDPVHTSESDVVVSAIGGSETSAFATSQISNEDFGQAIRASFERAKLCRKVLSDGQAKYRLDALIVQVNQPMFGGTFTVSMEVNYTLARMPKDIVWQKEISSKYAVSISEAFIGVTRLRLATEGAARKNIQQAIEEISKLQLE